MTSKDKNNVLDEISVLKGQINELSKSFDKNQTQISDLTTALIQLVDELKINNSEDDKELKKKLKKKNKSKKRKDDPNYKKRARSAYILFQMDKQKELKAIHPNLPQKEIIKLTAACWKDSPDSLKEEYKRKELEQKAANLKLEEENAEKDEE